MPANAGTQYAVTVVVNVSACDYWIIRLRG